MKKTETIKPPINSKRMSTKDRIKLTNNINNGNLKLFLEVKDEKGNLLGFQEIMTIDNYCNESRRLLDEIALLNDQIQFAECSEKRVMFKKIKKLSSILNELEKIKMFMLKDEFSFTDELEKLGSYKEEEITALDDKYLSLNKND